MAKHLIDTIDLSLAEIDTIFDNAKDFLEDKSRNNLKDKIIITIFFENSTRTRSSFEVAGKRLGSEVISLDVSTSSTSKGETLFDTAMNLDCMNPSAIIVRHKNSGVPKLLSKYVKSSIINAGDGSHAHPTQALLDLFTIKQNMESVKGKRVAIVGDIKNSRVANSNIKLLTRYGLDVVLVAPPHFMPNTNLPKTYHLEEVIDEVDVIMSLRTQTERHSSQSFASLRDYASKYCITKDLIKDRDILILHPGPVHRNIDIENDVLNDERCKVLEQVQNGVVIRMAILDLLVNSKQ